MAVCCSLVLICWENVVLIVVVASRLVRLVWLLCYPSFFTLVKRTRNPHQGHFSPPGKLQVSSTKVRKTSIHWPVQSQSHPRRTSKAPILQSALSGELLGGRGISRFFIFCQINSRIVFLLLGSFSSSLVKRGFPILTLLIVDEAQPKRTYYHILFYFGLPGGTARLLVPRLTASTGRRGSPLI